MLHFGLNRADSPCQMYEVLVAKTTANFGLPSTRTVYEKAIEVLPDKQTAEMCLRFASLERKLGEIDRARAIYAHGSQFCDPRVNPKYWSDWNAFEVETGSEDTFREMLRIKRAVQASVRCDKSICDTLKLTFSCSSIQVADIWPLRLRQRLLLQPVARQTASRTLLHQRQRMQWQLWKLKAAATDLP